MLLQIFHSKGKKEHIFNFLKLHNKPLPHKSNFNSLPNDKTLDWSELKAFADPKLNLTEKLKFILGKVENIVGKGENAGYYVFKRLL